MATSLINNIAFLIALAAVGQVVIARSPRKMLHRHVLLGLLFGAVALLSMANPVNFAPGVFFDGRSIVLAVAGVAGGGMPAAIAAGMAALYRYQLGGLGAPVGIVVVLMSALLGVLARQWWQRRNQLPRLIDYLALGVVVQLMQLAAFTQIPNRAAYAFIEQAWWVLLLFYPLATMLLCMMFRNYEQQVINQAALQISREALVAQKLASLQRFRACFDHSSIGFAITSTEKGWLEVNDALCTALGYTRDELARMTWAEITCPADLPADLVQFNRMLAGEISGYNMDKRFIHKDGHLVETHRAASLVRNPDGSANYVVSIVEDLFERNQARAKLAESERVLRTVVESTLAGFWDWNLVDNTEYLSPTFKRMFGYEDHEMASSPQAWQKIIFPGDLPGVLEAFDRHLKSRGKERFYHEVRYRHRNGSTVWVICVGRVIEWTEDGTAVRMAGCHIDITDRKLAEQELAQRNAELERFNRVSVNRELDMIALKKRVNALSVELGRAPPFELAAVSAAEAGAKR